MHSLVRAILVASAVALPLGGCANMDFDPGEWFAGELLSSDLHSFGTPTWPAGKAVPPRKGV